MYISMKIVHVNRLNVLSCVCRGQRSADRLPSVWSGNGDCWFLNDLISLCRQILQVCIAEFTPSTRRDETRQYETRRDETIRDETIRDETRRDLFCLVIVDGLNKICDKLRLFSVDPKAIA